jgi:hypothetical protein
MINIKLYRVILTGAAWYVQKDQFDKYCNGIHNVRITLCADVLRHECDIQATDDRMQELPEVIEVHAALNPGDLHVIGCSEIRAAAWMGDGLLQLLGRTGVMIHGLYPSMGDWIWKLLRSGGSRGDCDQRAFFIGLKVIDGLDDE